MKQFIVACVFFLTASLGTIFGLTLLLAKVLVPPAALDGLVTNYLGQHGPLALVLTSYALGVGLIFIVTRKLVVARFVKRNA